MRARKTPRKPTVQTSNSWSARGMHIVHRNPNALKPRANNPRTHSRRQVKRIAGCIKDVGFLRPVLCDGDGVIIAGHGATLAAIELGLTEIPTVCVDHLTPEQIRAYVIADNRLAELAGWDRNLLALELRELSLHSDFDVTVTGFETAEIDILIGELNAEAPDEADQVPEVDRSKPAVSQLGDLWRIGDHRLFCGDALDATSYTKLLGDMKAQLVFIDPPYNVKIAGNVSGLGKNKHREFVMASGEMSRAQFTEFLRSAFVHLCAASSDGSIHFICMDWRHLRELLDAADDTYGVPKNLCTWVKTNPGMGSLYRSQHELIFVFKNGSALHINNVELGRFGRNRSNVWTYAGVNSFGRDRDAELAMHPTVKPLNLVADAILDCSTRGGIVLDAFAGSGTTLIAAERTGRKGFGIELDRHYCDLILRRFNQVYRLEAIHAASGKPFKDSQAGQES
jgi:DNA modification methylase